MNPSKYRKQVWHQPVFSPRPRGQRRKNWCFVNLSITQLLIKTLNKILFSSWEFFERHVRHLENTYPFAGGYGVPNSTEDFKSELPAAVLANKSTKELDMVAGKHSKVQGNKGRKKKSDTLTALEEKSTTTGSVINCG